MSSSPRAALISEEYQFAMLELAPLFARGQETGRRQQAARDIPERETRFQPGDAGKARELLFMDALEIGEIARHHGDEVVVLARHQMTGNRSEERRVGK